MLHFKENYVLQKHKGTPTWEGILVSIQGSELFAVVTAEWVPGVALVGAQPQAVTLALRL